MIISVLLTVQSDTPDTKVLKVAADASEVKSTSSMGISSSSLKNNIQFGLDSGPGFGLGQRVRVKLIYLISAPVILSNNLSLSFDNPFGSCSS